jgi:hypothetical protein
MTEERVRAALRELAQGAPAHPHVEAVMTTPAVAHKGRKWLVPSLAIAAVALILLVTSVIRLPGQAMRPGAGGGYSIPGNFPAFSFVQGSTDGRFGRASAMYVSGSGHEDFTFSQLILVSAESDSYRRLEVPDDPDGGAVPARLSPDGLRVALGGDGVTIVELASGDRKHHAVASRRGTVPLAFSPDGRRVAYLSKSEPGGTGPLSILDLATGSVTTVTDKDVSGVAFSPDGLHFAYQLGNPPADGLVIGSLDGTPERRLAIPDGHRLAGAQAWSPDGRQVVMVATGPSRIEGDFHYGGSQTYVFLNADGTVAQEQTPVPADDLIPRSWGDPVIGWRSPAQMLVSTGDGDGTTSNVIAEVSLAGGGTRVLSRFAIDRDDDLAVNDVQLAAALVSGLEIRHSTDPDRGAWPGWAFATSLACLTPVVLLVLVLIRKRLRR